MPVELRVGLRLWVGLGVGEVEVLGVTAKTLPINKKSTAAGMLVTAAGGGAK